MVTLEETHDILSKTQVFLFSFIMWIKLFWYASVTIRLRRAAMCRVSQKELKIKTSSKVIWRCKLWSTRDLVRLVKSVKLNHINDKNQNNDIYTTTYFWYIDKRSKFMYKYSTLKHTYHALQCTSLLSNAILYRFKLSWLKNLPA